MNQLEYLVLGAVLVLIVIGFVALRTRSRRPGPASKEKLSSQNPSVGTKDTSKYGSKSSSVPNSTIERKTTAGGFDTKSGVPSDGDARPEDSGSAVPVSVQPRHGTGFDPASLSSEASTIGVALEKSRAGFGIRFANIFRKSSIDEVFWQDLEDTLILADVGVETSSKILNSARLEVKTAKVTTMSGALEILRGVMVAGLIGTDRSLSIDGTKPIVWLFVGVNGVGKTTTIGKVAQMVSKDNKVLFAAADTFRAAAADQLSLWAQRAGAQIVTGAPGGDPASVLFDAISSARAKGVDLVLGDTAGRLQNKTNLIEELKKIYRTIEKAQGTVGEVLLVIDATTGQNGLTQARVFREAVGVTGVVLTKLDGSAKGGIAFAIEDSLGIPVKLVGIGEGIDDLIPFNPRSYVDSLTEVN